MIRMYQFKSVQQMKDYYTAALAGGDYYTSDEQRSPWRGDLAKRLGLGDEVTAAAFRDLADNRVPGKRQSLTPRTDADRTAGYDINFHVPKSLSVLHLVTEDPRIIEALRLSVHETMQDIERQIQTRVRIGGQDALRPANGLVWGEFLHSTTRPVHGRPDPHLHVHCVCFNATWDPVEQRFKAGHFQDIKRDMPYHEAAFHSRLSWRMAELGYGITRDGRDWEITGIDRDIRDRYSRRTKSIEELAAKLGITNPDVKASLGARTRSRKASEIATDELRREWLSRLTPTEQSAIKATRTGPNLDQSGLEGLAARRGLEHALQHHFELVSSMPETRLRETALRASLGQARPEAVTALADAHPELLRRREQTQTWVTTRAALAEEQAMLDFARDGRGRCLALERNQPWEPETSELNRQQARAVSHLLRSNDRVMLLRGGAGTGKTTLLRTFAKAARLRGQQATVLAPTAEASRGVLRQAGFAEADTVAKFLGEPSLQAKAKGQVWFVDEAGLIGVPTMNKLFAAAREQDARIVLCGDSAQHAPVERGDALRLLETRLGLERAELSQIVRQSGTYREAVASMAAGRFDLGVQQLDQLGAIRQMEGSDWVPLVTDYLQQRREGRNVLVVAPTHAEGDGIGSLIRAGLKREGMLGQDDRLVPQLRDLHWSTAQRRDASRYQPDHVVRFNRAARVGKESFKAGEQLTVIGSTADGKVRVVDDRGQERVLPLERAASFSVNMASQLRISEGESIRLTGGGRTVDGKHRFNTGAVHRVQGFSPTGHIRLDNGWEIARDYGKLAHGYVSTSHAAQGRTVDWVLIAQGSQGLGAASAEQVYVSVSRGKHGVRIYTDDRSALIAAIKNLSQRRSATELIHDRLPAERSTEHAVMVQRLKQYEQQRSKNSQRSRPRDREYGYER